jgi:hypothetical protein
MTRIFISGEGISDLGGNEYDGRLFAGPLLLLVNDILRMHPKFQYDILECASETYTYISKQELEEYLSDLKKRRKLISLGRCKGYHSYNALALGLLAKEINKQESVKTMSFFFRDSDGVHSTPADDYQKKLDSIKIGFDSAGYANGVAILAKPKSEAWILSILDGCRNGLKYENCSGNDDSPNALKKQLAERFDEKCDTPKLKELLNELINNGSICHEKLSDTLTSYKIFHERTLEVLDSL